MRGPIKVKELMQREGLKGEVINLFPACHTGIVHGDDGYDVTFSDESLVLDFGYRELSVCLRVSYGVFFATGAKVPTAIIMQPIRETQSERAVEPTEAATPLLIDSRVTS